MKGERRKLEIRAESCYFEMGNEKPVGRSQYLPPVNQTHGRLSSYEGAKLFHPPPDKTRREKAETA